MIGGRMRKETRGEPVGTVIMHNVVSVGGFIADEKDDVGPLHEWYFSGDPPRSPEAAATPPKAATSSSTIPGPEALSRSRVRRRSTYGRCGSRSARS